MMLTVEEVEDGARRLAKSVGKKWDDLPANERTGFAMVVKNLAEADQFGDIKRSPEAVAVFLTWMGDP